MTPVKQVQKKFHPDEIRTTKISLGRLGRLGKQRTEIRDQKAEG